MIKVENLKTRLKLEYDFGEDEKGKKIIKSKIYSNLNENAEVEAIKDCAQTIASFSEKDLKRTIILKEDLVTEEA